VAVKPRLGAGVLLSRPNDKGGSMKRRIVFQETFGLLIPLLILNVSPAFGAGGATGQNLFEDRCADCHGLDARGSVKMAKTLKVDPLQLDLTRDEIIQKTSQDLNRLISGGHGKMPKHQDLLTPKQIKSLVKYLQSLQKAYVLGQKEP
jgi:mono/diheme cytochrome c family protein